MPTVLLVRHGQASFGADDYDLLSELGHRQAQLVADRLAALPGGIRPVVSGRMRRQRQTAEPLLAALDAPPRIDARFDEYDHEGILAAAAAAAPAEVLEGAPHLDAYLDAAPDRPRAFQAVLERALARWIAGVDDGAGETYAAFRGRVAEGLTDVVAELSRSPSGARTAVVVTSGGVIAGLVADALHLDPAGWGRLNTVIVNSSVTRLVVGRRGTTLVSVNDHAHLERDPSLLSYR